MEEKHTKWGGGSFEESGVRRKRGQQEMGQ